MIQEGIVVGCATLEYRPTLGMHTMHSNFTTIEDLIHTRLLVDSGVGDAVEGQDTTNSQHTGEIHCIEAKFSIHKLQGAVQDIQEFLPIVVLCVQSATMGELVSRLKPVDVLLDGREVPVIQFPLQLSLHCHLEPYKELWLVVHKLFSARWVQLVEWG